MQSLMSQKQLQDNSSNFIMDIFSVPGVDFNSMDSYGKTTLHRCAETNNLIIGALLLNTGADVNIKTKGDWSGKTPLHTSVESNHVDFVKLLVQCKANVNEQDDVYKKTALHFCAENGNKDIFDILLAAGADVNLTDRDGKTALHLSVEYGKDACYFRTTDADVEQTEREGKIVNILLDAGADVNMADKDGSTALDCAFCPFNEVLVKLLLKRGANVNRKDVDGRTPLHHCAKYMGKDMIVFLLEAGALENIRDNEGKTPLHYAVQSRNKETVQTLVKCKDILDITDYEGLTALHFSVEHNNSVLTEILLKAKATANIRNKEGKTALHFASMFGFNETVQTLLKYTDDLNTGDDSNQTALHYSVRRGCTEVVKTLLKAGACADVKDQYGKTPLHYITDIYDLEIIEVLIQYGASLDTVDTSGQTPLDVATQRNHTRAVTVLKQHGAKSSKENLDETNAVLDCSGFPEVKSLTDTTLIDWGSTTQCATVDVSPRSDDTTNTTTGSITTIVVTTSSTDTASATDVTSLACTTTADATDDTTTSTDTIPSTFTTQIAYTTANTIKTIQLKQPHKSTHKMYKRHQKYNFTQANLETLGEKGQPCSGKPEDDSCSGQKKLSRLGQTKDKQDMLVEREKTPIESIVQNKRTTRNKDKRKKIFDQLMRHHYSDDIKNPTKSMRNSSSIKQPKKSDYNLLRGGSADYQECSEKYSRKRRHQRHMRANSYRRKYFWKNKTYKTYDRERVKKPNEKSTSLDLKNSPKPNTWEWSDMDYVHETKQIKTQILTQNEVFFPVQTVLNTVQYALSTEMTRSCGNTVKTIVNVNINYTANIRDCNEVNIENVKYLAIDGKFGGEDG